MSQILLSTESAKWDILTRMDDSERQKINARVVEAFFFRARERKPAPGADRIYEAIRKRLADSSPDKIADRPKQDR